MKELRIKNCMSYCHTTETIKIASSMLIDKPKYVLYLVGLNPLKQNLITWLRFAFCFFVVFTTFSLISAIFFMNITDIYKMADALENFSTFYQVIFCE